jgi:hypothetical protein
MSQVWREASGELGIALILAHVGPVALGALLLRDDIVGVGQSSRQTILAGFSILPDALDFATMVAGGTTLRCYGEHVIYFSK